LSFDPPVSIHPLAHIRSGYAPATDRAQILEQDDDILDLSKIEAGQLDLENIPFRLRALIEDVTDNFRGKNAEKAIEFILTVDHNAPDGLYGDPINSVELLNVLKKMDSRRKIGSVRGRSKNPKSGDLST
jgi:hypothetical protein